MVLRLAPVVQLILNWLTMVLSPAAISSEPLATIEVFHGRLFRRGNLLAEVIAHLSGPGAGF